MAMFCLASRRASPSNGRLDHHGEAQFRDRKLELSWQMVVVIHHLRKYRPDISLPRQRKSFGHATMASQSPFPWGRGTQRLLGSPSCLPLPPCRSDGLTTTCTDSSAVIVSQNRSRAISPPRQQIVRKCQWVLCSIVCAALARPGA